MAQGSVTDWKPVRRRSPLCGPKINKGLSIAQIPAIDKVCSLNRQLTLCRGHYPAASPRFTAHFLPWALVLRPLNKNIKVSWNRPALCLAAATVHTHSRDHTSSLPFLFPALPPQPADMRVLTHTLHTPARHLLRVSGGHQSLLTGGGVVSSHTAWAETQLQCISYMVLHKLLSLSYFVCKMGTRIESTSQGCREDEMLSSAPCPACNRASLRVKRTDDVVVIVVHRRRMSLILMPQPARPLQRSFSFCRSQRLV